MLHLPLDLDANNRSEPFTPPAEPMPFSVLVSIAVFAGAWLSLAIVWVL